MEKPSINQGSKSQEKGDKKRIIQLEKELGRKEKALAEAASNGARLNPACKEAYISLRTYGDHPKPGGLPE